MKNKLLYVLTLVMSLVLIWIGHKIASQNLIVFDGQNDTPIVQAIITEITDHQVDEVTLSETSSYTNEAFVFNAKILYGDDKGSLVSAYQKMNSFEELPLKEVSVGDKVILYNYPDETLNADWTLGEYQRTDTLITLGIIFAVLLILFGRKQGFNTLVSLSLTILCVFFVFIPGVLSGQNIYVWTLIISIFVIFSTFLIVNGYQKKSFVAGIGCVSGVILSASMTLILNHILNLRGYIDENSVFLMSINPDNPIDLRAIIFAAIIIGALGAIMDVAMSISSALYELKENSPSLTQKMLIKSGFNIGRDIMGTMANTLILAYIGSSLSFVLLMVSFNPFIVDILNREVIISEILQALIGSFALLFTMPLTAIIAATVYTYKKHQEPREI